MDPSPERAIARVAEQERAALVAFARRRLGGRGEEAEDAVQDALVKALRAVRGGAQPEDPRAWLFTILAHCCADAHASAARRPTQPIPDGVELRDRAAGVARTVEARAEVAAALRSIGGLPEAQRQALVGYELGGETYDELGARHGWSVGATKSLLWRARSRLVEERAGWAQLGGLPLLALRGLSGLAERPAALLGAPWGTQALGSVTAAALGAAVVALPGTALPGEHHAHASRPAVVGQGGHRMPRASRLAGPAAPVRDGRPAATVRVRHAVDAPARSADPVAVGAACTTGQELDGRFTAQALVRARQRLAADAVEYSGCAAAIDRTLARGT